MYFCFLSLETLLSDPVLINLNPQNCMYHSVFIMSYSSGDLTLYWSMKNGLSFLFMPMLYLIKGPLIIGTDYAKYLCIKHNKVSVTNS
jgi:hypothetical protein